MSYIQHFENQELTKGLSLPFTPRINFRKLIAWWQKQAESNDPAESAKAIEVLKLIDETPQLKESIGDADELQNYQPQLEVLLAPFFPPILSKFDFKAAGLPFRPMFFNQTQRLARLSEASEGDIRIPIKDRDMMYIYACLTILNGYYRAGVAFMHDLHFDFHNKTTGVPQRFLTKINAEFIEIFPNEGIRHLTKEDIRGLLDNFSDVRYWREKIPPGSFRFEGFTIVTLFDVTHAESLSALKYDLLNKDAFADPVILNRIGQNLCALVNTSNLKAGFILYDKKRDRMKPIGSNTVGNIALSGNRKRKPSEVFNDTAIQFIFEKKQSYIIADAGDVKQTRDFLAENLVNNGIRCYLAMPLIYNDELIGILELAAEQAGVLNGMSAFSLRDICPILSNAMKRLQNEQQNEVEAVIRQKCTAIHPTVAWRFTEAAENLLELAKPGATSILPMEDIIFNEVYPLYGQADIQDSSAARNRAIQADMIEQLSLASHILDLAASKFSLPVYKDLQFRTQNYMDQLQQQLLAGDENKILEFFRDQLEPVFSFFRTLGGEMHQALVAYERRLDPLIGVVYDKRKEYENSVKLINECIAGYLEKAQLAAQEMFPHYLEKYKTDGVEHNLYIGQSLVETRSFHPLYIQNLRLWQLLVTCEIENEVKNIAGGQINPLRICSLILVHSNPVNIRFRMDEKKFDVDGAYNIRYEILKKRIDKAYVNGTNERLTQAGKLAIVYSQEKEALEYMNYLKYLQSIDYIGPDIEPIELKDLQGITGLRALRAEIRYNPQFEGITQSKAMQMSLG
jgi:hypothetical protein